MSLSKIAGVLLSSAALVAGHGYVTGAVVDGTYYGGYLITQYPYESTPPATIGWSDTATDLGFVDGSSYSSGDIICHKSAKPGAISAPVKAGGSVELQWSEWPSSHHGPVITYMANCNGDCSSVDKTTLKFFKIDEAGLIDDSNVPGTWASDDLIKNNNSRTITIPSTIESGNYVLRHEIIALHSAGNKDGAQNYPQCFNLKVTGGGSDSPSGTLGTALYKDTDPGILVNIYQSLSSYTIPGPALYTGAGSSSDSTTAASVAATTTAAPSSASSSVASVGVISSASPVSAIPIRSPSSIPPPHPYSTRLPRPSHSRRPGHGAAPSGRPHFSQPSGAEGEPTTAGTVTDYATATEYATATIAAQFTDSPNVQTPSADDSVTVTASAGGQSAASSTPVSSNSGSSSSSSGSSSSGSSSGSSNSGSNSGSSSDSSSGSTTGSSSGSSSYNSGDWSSYLSSMSADQFLSMLRETMKWLVSDQKVHARDLTV